MNANHFDMTVKESPPVLICRVGVWSWGFEWDMKISASATRRPCLRGRDFKIQEAVKAWLVKERIFSVSYHDMILILILILRLSFYDLQ